MKMLSPEEMQEYRNDIAGLGISVERQDELIRLIDAVVISFIDQSFGLDPVQLSLAARANYAFAGAGSCGNVRPSKRHELAGLVTEDNFSTASPEGRLEP